MSNRAEIRPESSFEATDYRPSSFHEASQAIEIPTITSENERQKIFRWQTLGLGMGPATPEPEVEDSDSQFISDRIAAVLGTQTHIESSMTVSSLLSSATQLQTIEDDVAKRLDEGMLPKALKGFTPTIIGAYESLRMQLITLLYEKQDRWEMTDDGSLEVADDYYSETIHENAHRKKFGSQSQLLLLINAVAESGSDAMADSAMRAEEVLDIMFASRIPDVVSKAIWSTTRHKKIAEQANRKTWFPYGGDWSSSSDAYSRMKLYYQTYVLQPNPTDERIGRKLHRLFGSFMKYPLMRMGNGHFFDPVKILIKSTCDGDSDYHPELR